MSPILASQVKWQSDVLASNLSMTGFEWVPGLCQGIRVIASELAYLIQVFQHFFLSHLDL